MIKIEKTEVVGWEHAIRGMRNAMNSWEKRDSTFKETAFIDVLTSDNGDTTKFPVYFNALDIGPNDHELMMKLRNAGTDHRKFMRMIAVYADVTAMQPWWSEFGTYKVGSGSGSNYKYFTNNGSTGPATTGSGGGHTHTATLSGNTGSKGSGTAHSNIQPYITCYFYKRTA